MYRFGPCFDIFVSSYAQPVLMGPTQHVRAAAMGALLAKDVDLLIAVPALHRAQGWLSATWPSCCTLRWSCRSSWRLCRSSRWLRFLFIKVDGMVLMVGISGRRLLCLDSLTRRGSYPRRCWEGRLVARVSSQASRLILGACNRFVNPARQKLRTLKPLVADV